ncbi:hypothetical protein HORIV_11500 [Vreelandella olivaria]|uniref:Phosphate transporter n=1 Tax=Vreelandella olivaria TaxID=390919 RepID=A0ABM8HN45_9GAMM|nr:hypothetical protein HORIV_11500 [Halomonas olivaria]
MRRSAVAVFEATLADDWDTAAELRENVTRLEHDADTLKTELRLNLPNTLFLPVSRSDLLDLISVQDKIANKVRDITGIMLGRKMRVPDELAEPMRNYIRTSVACVAQARQALEELKDLLESGFGKNVSDVMQKMIRELHTLEHQADDQQITIRRQLFALESQLPPVDVIFLYKIIEWVGELSDRAERVGSRLQILTARYVIFMLIIAQHGEIFIILACLFGFFMAWGVGANDVANAMGTSVGSKAITIKQAILIAVIFEFLGAWLAGGEVTNTIRKGIIDPELLQGDPQLLVYGMLAALLAAGTWLLVASMKGWPVSTTHSIVGAIVGFAVAGLGPATVDWGAVGKIAASWVVSPLLAGTIGFVLFKSVHHLIFEDANPFTAAKRYVPGYVFLVGFIVSMVTLTKGLSHVGLDLTFNQSLLLSILLGLVIMGIGLIMQRRIQFEHNTNDHFGYANVERVFGVLMIFTACAMAFAHGSNDVANAVGPLAAVISVVQTGGEIGGSALVPWWVLVLGGSGIVVGLVTYGHKVIATVGTGITELTPSRGFAATLAAATTVVLASGTGLPISTTHTLVGSHFRRRPCARYGSPQPAGYRHNSGVLADYAARRGRSRHSVLLYVQRHVRLNLGSNAFRHR